MDTPLQAITKVIPERKDVKNDSLTRSQSSSHWLGQYKPASADYLIIHLSMCNTKHFSYVSQPLVELE